MSFTNAERLIITMLCDIFRKLDIKDSVDPDFVQSAIFDGHDWALGWRYQSIFDVESTTKEQVSFVVNTLDMWSILEEAIEKLSPEEASLIDREIQPFVITTTKFRGFDGNNETDYMSISRFLVEKLDRFTRFAGRDFNSHMPSIDIYRRMYQIYEPIRYHLADRSLTSAEIIAIMKARVHPENRDK